MPTAQRGGDHRVEGTVRGGEQTRLCARTRHPREEQRRRARGLTRRDGDHHHRQIGRQADERLALVKTAETQIEQRPPTLPISDRKRVDEGKRGYDRVDLGGSRYLKK